MALTLDQYVQRVEDRLRRQVLSPDSTRNLSHDHVNEAIHKFLTGYAFKWALDPDTDPENTIPITAGDYNIALPTDTIALRSVELWTTQSGVDSSAWKLREKTIEWFSKWFPNLPNSTRSKPRFYLRYGYARIEIAPPSDGSYWLHIRRTKLPPNLVSGDPTPSIIPTQYDDAVVAYAVGAGFETLRQFQEATHWFQKFTSLRQLAIDDDKRSATDLQFIGEAYGGPGAVPAPVPANYWEIPEYREDPSI